MLCALILPLTANSVFATTDITTNVSDQGSGQNINNITEQTEKQIAQQTAETQTKQQTQTTQQTIEKKQTQQTAATNNEQVTTKNSSEQNIAAGSTLSATTAYTSVSFTSSQINDAASRVKTFIDTNHRLPGYVTISTTQVSLPQFLQLLTDNLININSGLVTSVTMKNVNNPSNPVETISSGNIYKSDYITIAQTIKTAIANNGAAPDYVNTTLGKMRYESLIYTLSKILSYQNTNQRLPIYVSVTPWTAGGSEGSSIPSSMQQYLVPTANCPSTNPTITSLAASITSGLTTQYSKATAIFNWVRDHLSYSYYYNTKKGALGALSSRTANCCDTSHLVVALSRAAGIPARYQLGNCQFSDGWFGHVWAQLYVNGKWYYADAISDSNTFGAINNWKLSNFTLRGTYASLPF